MLNTRLATAAILLTVASAGPLVAQELPKSQHGMVEQTVAHTEISLVYNRPVARGRKLFGALVPFGRPWCPGADSATMLTTSRDILVNGATLPAGSYSVWAIPAEARWTIIFSAAAHVFHIPYPEGHDALRVTAVPHSGPHMETLAFYFPVADSTHAELDLHWGETVVPLTIEAK